MFLRVARQADGLSGPSFSLAIGLLLLAPVLAVLLLFLVRRRYRARQSLMLQRVTELEALREAGRALVEAQLDIVALCELIAAEASKVIDTATFQIGLLYGDRYQIVFWKIRGERQPPQTFELAGENGRLISRVREQRRPLLVDDFRQEIEWLSGRQQYAGKHPPRSGLFIPLISGDETLGIMAAQSEKRDHFDEDDLRRLNILANQAAAAIANGRLFEQERTRAAYLEVVGQIAQQVNAIQDLDELFNQVVRLTRETFGFHPVTVFGIDARTGEAVLQASSLPGIEPGTIHVPEGLGLIGTAVATRQPIVSNYTRDDERFVHSFTDAAEIATEAEMVIPLIVDEELLGVLDVQSEAPGVFDAQEQMALEALAAQVAIAIHKTRQLAAQREQAWVTTAQLQVADAIGQSAGLEELLTAITRLTPLLVGVDQCSILLWDGERQVYEGAVAYGLPPAAAGAFASVELAIGDWNPLDAVHVGMARLATEKRPPWLERRRGQSVILYPLVAKGNMVGVMVVDEPQQPPPIITGYVSQDFFERQDELLRNIASQSALAIESEQLQIAQQEEAWVNTALLQVAEAVNRLIDLNEILDTIVRFIPMLVGVKSCLILIWDEAADCFYAGPSYGIDDMGRGVLNSFEISMSELPAMEAQEPPLLSASATVYEVRLPPWLQDILETTKAHALPLYARNSLVGALVVGPSVNERPLLGRRLNILTGIGQQAATAVVNNQLYKEAAERDRLERELDVARQIQASFIPHGSPSIPRCSVASFWQAARQVSGDFYDFMELDDGRWGIVVADVADKGVPAALFMALSRTILRTVAFSRYDPALTLERTNRIIWNDTTSDLFVTAFYATWNPRTRTLAYGNAGHNPPLLLRRNGQSQLLHGQGMAMGVLETITIKQEEVQLHPGDTVLFYTDGVTEAMNEDFDEFGLERLRLAAKGARQQEVAGMMAAITAAVRDHAGDTAQFDDITLVIMKCQA